MLVGNARDKESSLMTASCWYGCNGAEGRRKDRRFFPRRRDICKLRQVTGLGVIVGLLALGPTAPRGDAGEPTAVDPKSGSIAGQLLLATPELRDPRFVRTVVYMVQHDSKGAMGLVVNRPVGDVPLAILLDRLGMNGNTAGGDMRVHYGGPVEPTRGFVLHTTDYTTEGTHVVQGGMAVTSQPEIFRAISAGKGPRLSLLALGYAGWVPGQLEGEIAAGAWVVVPAEEALVFDQNYEKKWERAMARRRFEL
jgi:putative transcriptional regulator